MASATESGSRIVAPYITSWSAEEELSCPLVGVPGQGIAYLDEMATDRDRHGVLWGRMAIRPGVGRPLFGKVHPLRQRRAMSRLLCQVCAGPADRSDGGLLFLLKDHRQDWPGWPDEMAVTEPPVCLPCVQLSARVCPALRRGAVVVRAGRFEVVGVYGPLFTGGPVPDLVGKVKLYYDNPAVRWVLAMNLVRELWDCTLIELDELAEVDSCRS